MTKTELTKVVLSALEMINQARQEDKQIPIKDDLSLYGPNGHLDSMDLVSLLIDIEESLLDEGIEISLSDDKAMSQSNSPFQTVQTLVNFIDESLKTEA